MEHQPESESNSESASKSRTPTPGTRPVSSVALDTNGCPVDRLLIKNVENFYFLFDGFPYVIAPAFSTPIFSASPPPETSKKRVFVLVTSVCMLNFRDCNIRLRVNLFASAVNKTLGTTNNGQTFSWPVSSGLWVTIPHLIRILYLWTSGYYCFNIKKTLLPV